MVGFLYIENSLNSKSELSSVKGHKSLMIKQMSVSIFDLSSYNL